MPKYPDIEVELSGHDGNAFMIIGRVRKALRAAGYVSQDEMDTFVSEATSGDYGHLLATCAEWVNVS
jgi:hypothetical protein